MMKLALRRACGDLQKSPDLFVRVALHIMQRQHVAVAVRQARDNLIEVDSGQGLRGWDGRIVAGNSSIYVAGARALIRVRS